MKTRKPKAGLAMAATIGLLALSAAPARASSHRSAPAISQDPSANNTDVYAFRDPVDQTKVDIVANYIGLEQPAAGPNFANFADDVEYRVNINNSGSASDDIVYKFRFHTTYNQPLPFQVPVYNVGSIGTPNDPNQIIQTTYSIERDDSSGKHNVASNVAVAPANPGPRSFPSGASPTQASELAAYESVAAQAITALPGGGKVFAGPRKDAFFVDLGSIFDLVALRPIQGLHEIPNPGSITNDNGGTNSGTATAGSGGGVDGLLGKNVHSIELQLPIDSTGNGVLAGGKGGTSPADGSIIGVYASAARQRVRVLDTAGGTPRDEGRWVQVSRLGLPLINEVLVPIDQKDRWNGSDPSDDAANGFLGDILDPIPIKLLPTLYPSAFNAGNTPPGGAANRPDIVALATGLLIGAPASGPGSQAPADLLRVNLATAPVAGRVDGGNRLGALQGDTGGYPNGRRLTDDVVDIDLEVLAGLLLPGFGETACGSGPGACPDNPGHPSHALTQGIHNSADAGLLGAFPYLGPPLPGYYQAQPGAQPG